MARRWLFLLPVLVFAALAGVFAARLLSGDDPQTLPSALLDKPVPAFDLPPIAARPADSGLASADLEGGGVKLVNVFASWCVPCRIEHPVLTALAEEEGITVHGINYKDDPNDVATWLDELGDPFARVGVDDSGRTAIEWGVYGVPETFVVDNEGRIIYRHVGPVQPRDLEALRPLFDQPALTGEGVS